MSDTVSVADTLSFTASSWTGGSNDYEIDPKASLQDIKDSLQQVLGPNKAFAHGDCEDGRSFTRTGRKANRSNSVGPRESASPMPEYLLKQSMKHPSERASSLGSRTSASEFNRGSSNARTTQSSARVRNLSLKRHLHDECIDGKGEVYRKASSIKDSPNNGSDGTSVMDLDQSSFLMVDKTPDKDHDMKANSCIAQRFNMSPRGEPTDNIKRNETTPLPRRLNGKSPSPISSIKSEKCHSKPPILKSLTKEKERDRSHSKVRNSKVGYGEQHDEYGDVEVASLSTRDEAEVESKERECKVPQVNGHVKSKVSQVVERQS